MYLANKMHMQMHWLLLSLHCLFQLEPRRKYSSTVTTCIVRSSPLKIIRLQNEAFKSKRFLRPQQIQNLGIGDSHSSTISYMAYYLMTTGRQLPSEGKLLDSATIRSREHYITDHMMESYSTAFHIKRHIKPSEKLVTVCAELTNPDPNLEIDSQDLATHLLDPPWLHSSSTRTSSPNIFFMAIWDMGHRRHRTHHPSNIQRTSVHSSNNQLFFKWTEAIPLKEVKMSDMVMFIKHHVLYRFGVPWQIIHDNRP